MSVTESSEWRWRIGMANIFKGVVVGVLDPGYGGDQMVRWCGRHGMTDYQTLDGEEPDLDDPATCGAIIFGIFAPLHIYIHRREEYDSYWIDYNPNWDEPDSVVEGWRKLDKIFTWKDEPFVTLADVIQAVFPALDSEAGR